MHRSAMRCCQVVAAIGAAAAASGLFAAFYAEN